MEQKTRNRRGPLRGTVSLEAAASSSAFYLAGRWPVSVYYLRALVSIRREQTQVHTFPSVS